MTLRRKVVYFIGTYFADDTYKAHRVSQVGIMEMESGMSLEVCNAFAVVNRRASYGAVYIVSFFYE